MEREPDLNITPLEDPDKYLNGDYLKDEAEFIIQVSELMELLQSRAKPARKTAQFEFLRQDEGTYLYPDILQDRLLSRTLTSVEVTIITEVGQPSSTTVEFHDEDGTLYVSRYSDNSDLSTKDNIINIDKTVIEIPRIPNNQLNAFLYSVTGEYKEADNFLLSGDASPVDSELMQDILDPPSISTRTAIEYNLDTGRSARFDTTKVVRNNRFVERLDVFTLSYPLPSGKLMKVEIDKQRGLKIIFKVFEDGTSHSIIPDGGDYIQLIEIIRQEVEHLENLYAEEELLIEEDIFEAYTELEYGLDQEA